MKNRFGLFIITVAVLIMTAAFMSTTGATSDPFVGKWASTDTDGSYQILTIGSGSGSSYHIRVYDFGASTCGLDPETGDFLSAASIEGTLSLSNGMLSGTLPLYCQSTPPTFYGYAFLHYTYDPTTDILVDGFGVVWSH
jgi:hypothetical protein